MHNKKWEVYIIWAQWDVKCSGDRMGKGVLTGQGNGRDLINVRVLERD